MELTWQNHQAPRQRESTIIPRGIKNWLDTAPLGQILPKSDVADALRNPRNH